MKRTLHITKKQIIFTLIIILLIVPIGLSLNNAYQKYEEKRTQEFFNEGLLISVNVFLRVNALPLVSDYEKVKVVKQEVDEYYKAYKKLKRTSETVEGEVQLDKVFKKSFELFDLAERIQNKDPDANEFQKFDLMTEVQHEYLLFSTIIDIKKIPLSDETVHKVKQITFDFLEKQK